MPEPTLEKWPLDGIRIVTIIKIISCNVYHHEGENAYCQILITGFILSSAGDVMIAEVHFGVEEDCAELKMIVDRYAPDSIHWLESSSFSIIGGGYHFYGPVIWIVEAKSKKAMNEFFPIEVARDRYAQEGEFWYADVVYVPGKGDLAYGNFPWAR